jgi:hypothetical protein
MGKPFVVRPTPTTNVNAGLKVESASREKVFEHVKRKDDDDDLTQAGRELSGPDHEVGALKPYEGAGKTRHHHADHVETPIFKPAIPWPPADNGKVPFKLK